MTYKIARDGQEFGPYSLSDVQRYVGTGNILLTDLARAEGETEWISVAQVVGTIAVPQPGPTTAYAAMPDFPDAPNLHWGFVLLFALLSCGLFSYAWDIVQAVWAKKVQPDSKALTYYLPAIGILILVVALSALKQLHSALGGINAAGVVLILIGRFKLRTSLENHFNTAEPIGLSLSGVMTFFFGPIYFQYHLNRINAIKQAARLAGPTPY